MPYTATPYAATAAAWTADPSAMLGLAGRKAVHAADGYQARSPLAVQVDDPHSACEAAWTAYQNLDAERRTPDGGRSLMMGDLMKLEDSNGAESWWICRAIGWSKVAAPGESPEDAA